MSPHLLMLVDIINWMNTGMNSVIVAAVMMVLTVLLLTKCARI